MRLKIKDVFIDPTEDFSREERKSVIKAVNHYFRKTGKLPVCMEGEESEAGKTCFSDDINGLFCIDFIVWHGSYVNLHIKYI